jgi:hypothetical protein
MKKVEELIVTGGVRLAFILIKLKEINIKNKIRFETVEV